MRKLIVLGVLALLAFAASASARPMPGPTSYGAQYAPTYLDRHK